MISFCNLGRYGRLGNQMFQCAALMSVASHYGVECSAPIVDSEISKCFKLGMIKNGCNNEVHGVFREVDFSFSDFLFKFVNPEHNTDLIGYFQSERYFKNFEGLIRKEFAFRDEVKESASSLKLEPENKVSVHIRRTDYLNLNDIHPVQTEEYYSSAMEKFPDAEFLVFSDDIEWCRKSNLFSGGEKSGFHFSSGNTYQDLFLMSQCRGHVIANSSFSWWGAWLSNSERIVAPKQWFGPKGPKDWQDIYCEGWIIL